MMIDGYKTINVNENYKHDRVLIIKVIDFDRSYS